MIYTSKPQQVEAIQWTGANYDEVVEYCHGKFSYFNDYGEPNATPRLKAGVNGAQGWVPVPVGHWIVHAPGDKTDMWPVDPDYFKAKYEAGDTALPKPIVADIPREGS